MFIERIPNILRLIYRRALWRGSASEKVIYLTIDDGPTTLNTQWILDLLDKYGVKATFFCIGRNVEAHPELYNMILENGHRTGLHGYDHKRGLYSDTRAFFADIEHASQFIKSDLFRPPHGNISPRQLRELSKRYTVVLWDVITRDYNRDLSGEDVLNIAMKYSRNGSIVVFHDSEKAMNNMRYALPKAIEYWIKEGYSFKLIL
ncbi:MAG: polysaccharide deacetylase family protein [Paludibacteraceae bacterium]|nr:polysaccharide deacetylase family protein [Paludibacteraceae bacterium]MBO7367981.1 polysaccharide deacetylase family protein [Paludibacteraceae bacterium]MBR4483051.1 polysaccharide deacetylase family protein [Paludibacteraceae bacterium]